MAMEDNKRGNNEAMQEVGGNTEWQRKTVRGMEE